MEALRRITWQAAQILKIPAGSLAPGNVADVCIFDPQATWQVGPQTLVSQGRNTPFLGYELAGQVQTTLVAGRIVYQR